MTNNTEQKLFTIKIINDQDKESVLKYLRQYFYDDEPLNNYLNQQNKEKPVANDRGLNSASSIKEGLSIMAVTPSNEIIGVVISKNYTANSDEHNYTDESSESFIKIRKLVYELEEQMADLVKLSNANEKEMSVRVISVHPEWRNKGIGFALLEYTREIARKNGFHQIRCICSSAYSAGILKKLRFSCLHSIKYEDYKENGEVIFKPDSPHTHIQAMVLKIDRFLR